MLWPQKAIPFSTGTKAQNCWNERPWLVDRSQIRLNTGHAACLPGLKMGLCSSCILYCFLEIVQHFGKKDLAEHFHIFSCFRKRKQSHPSTWIEVSCDQSLQWIIHWPLTLRAPALAESVSCWHGVSTQELLAIFNKPGPWAD